MHSINVVLFVVLFFQTRLDSSSFAMLQQQAEALTKQLETTTLYDPHNMNNKSHTGKTRYLSRADNDPSTFSHVRVYHSVHLFYTHCTHTIPNSASAASFQARSQAQAQCTELEQRSKAFEQERHQQTQQLDRSMAKAKKDSTASGRALKLRQQNHDKLQLERQQLITEQQALQQQV